MWCQHGTPGMDWRYWSGVTRWWTRDSTGITRDRLSPSSQLQTTCTDVETLQLSYRYNPMSEIFILNNSWPHQTVILPISSPPATIQCLVNILYDCLFWSFLLNKYLLPLKDKDILPKYFPMLLGNISQDCEMLNNTNESESVFLKNSLKVFVN